MELIHPSLNNNLGGSWRSADGKPTPGSENSVFADNAAPQMAREQAREDGFDHIDVSSDAPEALALPIGDRFAMVPTPGCTSPCSR